MHEAVKGEQNCERKPETVNEEQKAVKGEEKVVKGEQKSSTSINRREEICESIAEGW